MLLLSFKNRVPGSGRFCPRRVLRSVATRALVLRAGDFVAGGEAIVGGRAEVCAW